MGYFVKIFVIIILLLGVLYLKQTNVLKTEHFDDITQPGNLTTLEGNGLRHPVGNLEYASINNRRRNSFPGFKDGLDPDTILKLKDTILTDVSRTSKTEVAYNDVGAYRPDRIRPFNDAHSRLSEAEADNFYDIADQFDNSFYRLWIADEKKERDAVMKRAAEIKKSKLDCVNFKNVNECMSVCTDTPNCTGFYFDSPGKCCMLIDPPYEANRHAYNKVNNEIDVYGHRTIDSLIRRAEATDGKLVFNYIRSDGGNDTYTAPLDRNKCKAFCPKCIMGRCPDNYRCTNLTADPRYNYSCMITNEGRYNERKGFLFDSPEIPYLDDKYALNEYAGYDDSRIPITYIPESYRFNLDEGIVPSKEELNAMYAKFDSEHIGPHTYFNKTHDEAIHRNSATGNKSTSISGLSKIRGPEGFKGNIETFDPWVNTNGFDPAYWSERSDLIAVRGGNDPVNLEGYQKYHPRHARGFYKEGFSQDMNDNVSETETLSERPDYVAIRGGNDPTNLESYHKYEGFCQGINGKNISETETLSERPDYVAVRGSNDPINLDSYHKFEGFAQERKPFELVSSDKLYVKYMEEPENS
jgi:hypothetical protein